jgi:hypothetical protein
MIRHRNNRDGLFGVIAEFVDQGPILMESEDLSYDAAFKRAEQLKGQRAIRVCIVALSYENGNATLCPPQPADEVDF